MNAADGRAVPGQGDRGARRLLGVDAARGLALVGMFATHTLPLRDNGPTATATALIAEGRASALFAVLAGVGVALASGGPQRPRDGRERLAVGAALAVRGVLVGVLGLVLVSLDVPVLVILAFYGLMFLVAAPLVALGPVVLAAGALVACVATPVVSHLLRTGGRDVIPPQQGLGALADPAGLFVHLAVTGFYPVLTWTTYLLAGMAVGRLDLRRTGVATGLLGGGLALAVFASTLSSVLLSVGGEVLDPDRLTGRFYGTAPTDTWWWLAVHAAHSGTPLDLAHTIGSALAVLGAMLLLARWSRAAVWVPAAIGAVPLTLYVLHALALSAFPSADDAAVLLVHLLAALAVGIGLRLARRRGPLEQVVARASRTARAAVRDHASTTG